MQQDLIYHYHPASKIYSGQSSLEFDPIENKALIPANATLNPVIDVTMNQVAVFNGESWSAVSDYRGYVGYDAEGVKKTITETGIEPDPIWTENPPFVFSTAIGIKTSEITISASQAFSVITASYLQEEIDSFKTQEEEALAWRADNAALTPILDGIVANRLSVTKEVLVNRILDVNVPAYKAITGTIMGKKQHYEDLIDALKVQDADPLQPDVTQLDLDNIMVSF
tara:strand:- start:31331 stop:32008 length:678 start_codon:yes stop_codon:yes gene_type:complete